MIKIVVVLLLAAASVEGSLAAESANGSARAITPKMFDELNAMEVSADEARRLFWRGRYKEAAEIFARLSADTHVSRGLYRREEALCHLALGSWADARRCLLEAAQYLDTYNTPELEKRAASYTGREAEKIYFGDPYEQAATYFLLACAFINERDYDNALAACKSGLLADSDSVGNRYQSDFTLLHLLEGRCHQLRGQPDLATAPFKLARESYRSTHPSVREIFSDRLDRIELKALSARERKRMGVDKTDAAIETEIQDMTLKMEKTSVPVESELSGFLEEPYNVLLVVPSGKAPRKYRQGSEGNLVKFAEEDTGGELPEILVDGKPLGATNHPGRVADISFQALTRGGRQMDSILKGQASFKRTTAAIGRSITEAGAQAGGLGGLAVMLIGGIVSGSAGTVSAEADARCWRSLPGEYAARPLQLGHGTHEVEFRRFLYFEALPSSPQLLRVAEPGELHIVFATPDPVDRFSAQVVAQRGMTNRLPTGLEQADILLPPPLGFGMIERFPSPDQRKFPRALAPDPNRITRVVFNGLTNAGFRVAPVRHSEATAERRVAAGKASLALQVELDHLDWAMTGDQELFTVVCDFRAVRTATGTCEANWVITGTYLKGRRDKADTTEAFYKCLENALGKLVSEKHLAKQLASR